MVGTDVLENRVHPHVVLKLFLTKGVKSDVQLFATLTNKIPKANHGSIHSGTRDIGVSIHSGTRNIGARPYVV